MSRPDERIDVNRAMWDERVPIHVGSAFYDVGGFRSGRDALEPFEVEELGPVDGLDLLHLQCHFGLDTLSWARHGATVWGLDFSQPAVDAAQALADELGLDGRFICADVYDAVAAVGGRRFDVVYTGLGALNWLPDLPRWGDVVAALVRSGGTFYLAEFHPVAATLGDSSLEIEQSYFFEAPGTRWEDEGTYADLDAPTTNNESWEWNHPLSEVFTVLLDRGFTIESFHEFDYTLFRRWDFLEEREPGRFVLPDNRPSVPLMYSLRATAPS